MTNRIAAPSGSQSRLRVRHAGANNTTQLAPVPPRVICTHRLVPRILRDAPGSVAPRYFKVPPACRLDLILDTQTEVLSILDDVLSLGGRAMTFDAATPLLGAIPELDSMAVVTLISSLEERFGILVDDDEISGDTFATVGTVTTFVAGKLAA